MLTIKNLTRRTIVFNLPHEAACSESVCTCSRMKVGVTEHNPATGDRTLRKVNQRVAKSITLFPKGTLGGADNKEPLDQVTGLLDGVGRVPEIAQARARREIEWTHTPDDGDASKASEPAAAKPAGSDTKTKKAAEAAMKE